ncbi:N-acetylmuramoyl-L-alanine amidase [Longimicrobium sp.]|uniref:N-acetylmuramoyl-L-alanine amidase n=1 Tax=Longimicrobium sp. TaxID=2029185 RepID=UPI002C2FDB6A|nr:N-acetylmuramoyl-L-alanine amidase [Longimicrobium sp.]HSU15529.1 N-acetylmuramoyl-L-alanine amidase [Longimicrobium sp.]
MPLRIPRPAATAFAALLIAACATASSVAPSGVSGSGDSLQREGQRGALPPVPARTGPLAIDVVYPDEGAALTVSDSNFVFGNVGTGGARLTINGAPVEVAANGAFLAYLPVPPNGVYQITAEAEARSGSQVQTQQASLRRTVRVPVRQDPPAAGGPLAIVAGSITPTGAMTMVEGEPVTVRFRATPGARARLLFSDGTSWEMLETRSVERAEGFQQDVSRRPREVAEYAVTFPAWQWIAGPAGPAHATVWSVDPMARRGTIELVRGRDTLRAPLPLEIGVLEPGMTRVAIAAGSREDSTVIGQAVAGTNTPYNWFFPNGTVFTITGEREGFYRARLTQDLSVWIDAKSLRLLPPGSPVREGAVGTVRVAPAADWVDFRFTVSDRLPYRVTADGNAVAVEIYGAATRTNWAHYGPEDAFVRRVSWDQPRSDLFAARLETAEPVWGWRSFYDASGTLVVRVRRPPRIDREHPLAGRSIAIDAGHPPGGAIGPTRLTEAEANLAIARRLVRMLRAAGARVLETRPDTAAVALNLRPVLAERANVELLVSVHNNAFPDGVNPFANAGTAAFYNAPQSMELARGLQHELLGELGLRDLGIARADLALVRSTWFPSSLTETMFLMVPQQEAALRDPVVQERIARAHFRALEGFFRGRAR